VNDRTVTVNGLRLHALEWGHSTAPPVLLLHGGSAHAHWWDLFAESIADRFHVFALDLRGHGDSEHARSPAYRVGDYAGDVAAFVERVTPEPIHLIGHSLGGIVAAAYAGRAPARLRSLVVVDSLVRITQAGARYMKRLHHFPQPCYRTRDEAIRRFRLLPTQTNADATVLAHVAATGLRPLPDGRWTFKFDRESLAHAEPQDLTPLLSRLTCPMLFVRGAHSTLLSPRGFAELSAAVPHAEQVEIANAHHHVMLDNPTEFSRAVRGFLDRTQNTEHRTQTKSRTASNPS